MVQRKYFKNVVVIIMFIFILFNSINLVNAQINDYGAYQTTEVTDENLDAAAKNDNSLLQPIASLIYFGGNIIEWILGAISKMVAGGSGYVFPWADAILFNAVPMLDVNFINPASSSLISGMGGVIRTVYFTLLSLSIAFFGISVIVMAIRLVTSTIAQVKATAKDSIMKWLMGLTLLFTMHYFIAFVFFANESMVKVASDIAVQNLGDNTFDNSADNVTETSEYKNLIKMLEKNFGQARATEIKNLFENNTGAVAALLSSYNGNEGGNDFAKAIIKDTSSDGVLDSMKGVFTGGILNIPANIWHREKQTFSAIFGLEKQTIENIESYINTVNITKRLSNYEEIADKLKKSSDAIEIKKYSKQLGFLDSNDKSNLVGQYIMQSGYAPNEDRLDGYIELVNIIKEAKITGSTNTGTTGDTETNTNNPNKGTVINPISNLATFFRQNAFTASEGSIVADKASVTGALMYTIFVAQSLIFFISYLKRLFFVIILACMAPIIVVFDFAKNSAGLKDGSLSNWIKEFCTLVFIQTIQAFIFAIVVIMITTVQPDTSTVQTNSAIGVIGIIGLISIAKVEDIVKKILGVKSGVMDPSMKGGLKSLLGTVAVAGMFKKTVGNNFNKISSGISETRSANRAIKREEARYNQKMGLLLANDSDTTTPTNPTDTNGSNNTNIENVENINNTQNSSGTYRSRTRDDVAEIASYLNRAKQAGNSGDMQSYIGNMHQALNVLNNQVVNVSQNVNGSGRTGNRSSNDRVEFSVKSGTTSALNKTASTVGGTSQKASRQMTNKDKLKILEMQEAHEDKINESKKKIREGRFKLATGVAESIAAVPFGVAGAAIGVSSTGEVDDLIKGAGMGASAGDFLVSNAMKAGQIATETVKTTGKKAADSMSKEKRSTRKMQEIKMQEKKEKIKKEVDQIKKDVSNIE